MLAAFLGQRQADVLALTWSDYRGGAFRVCQAKTGEVVEVPAVPELKSRLESLAGDVSTEIVVAETTGRPYKGDHFRREFAAVRRAATPAAPELADLQFMDLRRTAVVWLAEEGVPESGIAAITGHRIEGCRRILETYLPRNTAMAAAAIARLAARRARVNGRDDGKGDK